MNNQIEAYIRNSAGSPLLNFHVPENLHDEFINGIKKGSLKEIRASINFEMPLGDHAGYHYDSDHLRIDINNIYVSYFND